MQGVTGMMLYLQIIWGVNLVYEIISFSKSMLPIRLEASDVVRFFYHLFPAEKSIVAAENTAKT
jgi:hypothetical protein